MLFLVFFFGVLLEAFLFVTFFFPSFGLSTSTNVFWFDPCGGFWLPPRPLFFKVPPGSLSASIIFFPHLLWGYCANNLFWELGSCRPYHCLEILVRFSSVLVGGDKCKQFKFTCIPSPLEVNVVTFSYSGNAMHIFFEQLAKRGVDWFQKSILKRLNMTISFPASFMTCL